MARHLSCDGIARRDFLKVGFVGGAGLSLASYLRMSHAGEVSTGKETARLTPTDGISSVSFSPDGKYIVSGGE